MKHNISANEIIDYCVKEILSLKKRPLMVVVTGGSGSGKSYYSALLKEKLEALNVNYSYVDHDDFLIPRKDREPMKTIRYQSGEFKGKSYWEVLENMFRLDVFENVIKDLKNNRSSTYNPYLRETGDIDPKPKTVMPSDIVVFDASMLIDKMDFVIMIEVSRENILKRKVKRDSDIRTPEEIIEMHQKVQGYYWDRCKPKNPDIIIDNNDFSSPNIVRG